MTTSYRIVQEHIQGSGALYYTEKHRQELHAMVLDDALGDDVIERVYDDMSTEFPANRIDYFSGQIELMWILPSVPVMSKKEKEEYVQRAEMVIRKLFPGSVFDIFSWSYLDDQGFQM